jgi:hypothetical protein
MALTVGQGSPAAPLPLPPSASGNSGFASEQTMQPVPRLMPVAAPASPTLPATIPVLPSPRPATLGMYPVVQPTPAPATLGRVHTLVQMPPKEPGPTPGVKVEDKKNGNGAPAPVNGTPETKNGENGQNGENGAEPPAEKAFAMKMLEGTYHGAMLEACGVNINGWIAMSYNASTRNLTNLPYVWNDRADTALLQQFWVDIEKPTDWDKLEVQHGWKVSLLYGSDYRYTLMRGFLNNQLKNSRVDDREPNGFEQNIYGGDIPIFQYSVFVPGLGGEGTEFTFGRMFCQFGYESVMATSTPFMSRSYAFNWAPPFFHVGAMSTTKVNQNVIVKHMIINGNDVFFDGSQEWRYSGTLALTSDDEKTALIFGTTIGRGRFEPTRTHGPDKGITTIGVAYEPAGRNNINVFDAVLTHTFDEKFSVALEGIYGYQTNVPAAATGSADNFGGANGTARWASAVGYAFYNLTDHWTLQARAEAFYDAEGQRTGFEGLYYSGTLGLICRPCDSVLVRPEIRYDYNDYSTPFSGRHGIFVAGFDVIVKF